MFAQIREKITIYPLNYPETYLKVSDRVAETHPFLRNLEDHVVLVVGIGYEVDTPEAGILKHKMSVIRLR